MAAWDDEEFEVKEVSDKWDGEDEDDDDLKDNWDDDEEEGTDKTKNVPVSKPKVHKTRTERIAEKEEKRKEEHLAKQEEMKRLEKEEENMTPEQLLADKLAQQRLQEESDLELAKEAFGVDVIIPGLKTIDNFNPKNKEEFTELSNMISKKLIPYEEKSEYSTFLENLFRDCCAGVDPEDIRRISNSLNILATEKQKLAKSAKGGKKKTTAKAKSTLSTGKGVRNEMSYDDDLYNEYEDFM